MSERQLAPVQTWLRLFRDWHSDPRLVRAADKEGSAAAAGYLVLLGRAANTGGVFPDFQAVADGVRADGIAITAEDAQSIANTLIATKLLSQDGDGFAVTDWHLFQPPANTIPPKRRPMTPSRAPSLAGVTERENDREKEKREGDHPLTTPPLEAVETVVLPQKRTGTATECSHGLPFHPKVIKDGVTIITADHQFRDGAWCREKPVL